MEYSGHHGQEFVLGISRCGPSDLGVQIMSDHYNITLKEAATFYREAKEKVARLYATYEAHEAAMQATGTDLQEARQQMEMAKNILTRVAAQEPLSIS